MNKIKIKTDIIYNKCAKDNITIIHIADIHFNINFKKRVLDRIKDSIICEGPNYVIITGDIIDSDEIINNNKINELMTFFSDISKMVKVIISLGNHDIFDNYYTFFSKLDNLDNVYVLDNYEYTDESIYVSGFTLPWDYYYSLYREESVDVLLKCFDSHKKMLNNLVDNKIKIALIHSPIKLTDDSVLDRIKEYDIILSGHTHDGMVPEFLKFLFGSNRGIISPYKKLFPKIARGNIYKDINDKKIAIIITGGITKLSLRSAKALSKLNFIYNIGINKIIVREKR